MAIVTYEDVKAHLNLSDDRDAFELQSFIDAATNVVEQEIGPVLPTSYTETQFVGGRSTLVLNHPPIQSIQSVVEYAWNLAQTLTEQPFGSSVTTLGYVFEAESGLLRRYTSGFPTYFMGPVTVTYTAGRTTIPPAVRMATLVIVAHLWQTQRGTSPLPSLGGEQPAPVGPGGGIPLIARELLKGYDNRIPTVA
jgi:hypothetical protein